MTFEPPIGPLAKARRTLVVSLADCDEWRDWTRTTSRDDALLHIHEEQIPPAEPTRWQRTRAEWEQLRPHAVVSQGDFVLRNVAGPVTERASGLLVVEIEDNYPVDLLHAPAEAIRRFLNRVGGVMTRSGEQRGLLELSAVAGYKSLENIHFADWWRANEKERVTDGDYFYARLEIEWGTPP